eukprot:m.46788 g.46788  ORF g.46788 m.46788 type:complete len:882 (-) comp10408_c0_seq1:78-2723(-)
MTSLHLLETHALRSVLWQQQSIGDTSPLLLHDSLSVTHTNASDSDLRGTGRLGGSLLQTRSRSSSVGTESPRTSPEKVKGSLSNASLISSSSTNLTPYKNGESPTSRETLQRPRSSSIGNPEQQSNSPLNPSKSADRLASLEGGPPGSGASTHEPDPLDQAGSPMLAEMMFGAVPINTSAPLDIRVHELRGGRVLITFVFSPPPPIPFMSSRQRISIPRTMRLSSSLGDSLASSWDSQASKGSPMAMPAPMRRRATEGMGFVGSWSPGATINDAKQTTWTSPSRSHQQLRQDRSEQHSIDFGLRSAHGNPSSLRKKTRDVRFALGLLVNPGHERPRTSRFSHKRTASATSVNSTGASATGSHQHYSFSHGEIDPTLLKRFIMTHFVLVERELIRARNDILRIYQGRAQNRAGDNLGRASTTNQPTTFRSIIRTFLNNINSLFVATRIKSPVWLDLWTFSTKREAISNRLSQEIIALLAHFKTIKARNFLFRSIGAVLSKHVGWIPTVMPSNSELEQLEKCSPVELLDFGHRHPYDCLWAQFSDLVGVTPGRATVCRTVVVGKSSKLVNDLLHVLSYFIRCNEVFLIEPNSKSSTQTVCDLITVTPQTPQPVISDHDKILESEGHSASSNLTDKGTENDVIEPSMSQPKEKGIFSASQSTHEDAILVDLPEFLPESVMPCLNYGEEDKPDSNGSLFADSLGRSLLGGIQEHLVSGLVLQGMKSNVSKQAIMDDLQTSLNFTGITNQQLRSASCIVINVDSLQCTVLCGDWRSDTEPIEYSQYSPGVPKLISDMFSSFEGYHLLGAPADFCISHIDDKLREVYLLSNALLKLLVGDEISMDPHPFEAPMEKEKAMVALGLEGGDFELVDNVARSKAFLGYWKD